MEYLVFPLLVAALYWRGLFALGAMASILTAIGIAEFWGFTTGYGFH